VDDDKGFEMVNSSRSKDAWMLLYPVPNGMGRFNNTLGHNSARALASAAKRGISVRRINTLFLVMLLIMSSFTLLAPPAAAAFPPPVADAGEDQNVEEGESVTLDGSGSFDLTPGGEALTYRWDLDSSNGSGDTDARGKTVTVKYADAGLYTVTLTVSDGDFEDTDTARITVIPVSIDNTPPIAYITSPLPGVYNVSTPIDFEGNGFDADDDPLSGEWDFGDGTSSRQPITTHTYTTEGPQVIRWKVTDGKSNNTARMVIMIGEAPDVPVDNTLPEAVIKASKTNVTVDEMIRFDATDSTDEDGDKLSFEWHFDITGSRDTDSTEAVVNWAYNDTGDYTVLLIVRDGNQGGVSYATEPINVVEGSNDPPDVNAGNDAQVEVGVPLTFRGTASDPDGDNITLYTWEFGDGDMWEHSSSGQTNHTYRTPGTFTATFTAEDERGERGSDSRTITVNPPPDRSPVAHAGEDITRMQGETVEFQGKGTDDFGIARYQWDFNNDGVWDYDDTTNGNTQHTYLEDGTYTAIFRVTDEPRPGNPGPGQTDQDSLIVTILRNQAPEARIVVTTIFVQTGELVKFQSDSDDPEGARLDYAWDLDGDGRTDSNAENPTWTYRREGEYMVTLTATDDHGQSDTDQITIDVSQTYSVSVDITSPIRDLDPGDTFEFRATISNDGNGNDQIRITLSGQNNAWASLGKSLISLNATEKQTITITVVVPQTAYSTDDALITVTATSTYYTPASDAKDIEVHIRQNFVIGAEMDVDSIDIKTGESREDIATITITNDGNGPDSFRISFSGDITGYLRTSTPKVDLAPGETRDVTISILVVDGTPTGAAIGTVIVSSTNSVAKKQMGFTINIEGADENTSPISFDLWTVVIIVVVLAVVAALAVGLSRSRRKKGSSEKPVKTTKASGS
jgi:PKD repeat protein